MAGEISTKYQNILWWVTSIAVSVLCCSVLFVLFASYLVDVKTIVQSDSQRLTLIEDRQDKLSAELDLIRKHVVLTPSPTAAAPTDNAAVPAINVTAPEPAEMNVPSITPPSLAPVPPATPDK